MSDRAVFFKQTRALTLANLKTRYRKTVAGFLWVVLYPMITFGVQALVFGQFLKLDVEHYLLFLVSGLVPWIFIAQTLEMSVSIFVNSGPLMKSFSASPLVYLSAQVLDNFVNFVVGFLVALVPIWLLTTGWQWQLLLLPIPIAALAVGVFALAWLLATAQVFFRDTRFLIGFAVQIGFFLTPVFYPREFVPPALRWLIAINPLYYLISPFQVLVHDFSARHFAGALGASAATSLVLLTAAAWIWDRRRNQVYFHV